jgi:hypothetical protein
LSCRRPVNSAILARIFAASSLLSMLSTTGREKRFSTLYVAMRMAGPRGVFNVWRKALRPQVAFVNV